jgi:hypothetical protein
MCLNCYAPGPYHLSQGGKRRGPTARNGVKLVEPAAADEPAQVETLFGAEEFTPWVRI